jgi:LytS/YehU family sensor histidine kinase
MSYGILPLIAMAVRIFVYDVTFLYSSTTLSLTYYLYIYPEQTASGLYRQERELAESRIELMISQIQPHFVFNTLNSVRELIYSDADKADRMIVNFSKYLRTNFNSLQGTSVAFSDELQKWESTCRLKRNALEIKSITWRRSGAGPFSSRR